MSGALRTYGVLVFPTLAVIAIIADADGVYGWLGFVVLAAFNFTFAWWHLRRRRQRISSPLDQHD